jgi:hypothetical protein
MDNRWYFKFATQGTSQALIEQVSFNTSSVTSLDWVTYLVLRFKDHPKAHRSCSSGLTAARTQGRGTDHGSLCRDRERLMRESPELAADEGARFELVGIGLGHLAASRPACTNAGVILTSAEALVTAAHGRSIGARSNPGIA